MTEFGVFGATGWPISFRLRAIFAAIVLPPLVFVAPFSILAGFLTSGFPRTRVTGCHDKDVARWVDLVLNRLTWPWNYTCLKRASVVLYLLRSMGRAVVLNVGVRREDGELKAHAWLTLNSIPYLEPDAQSLEALKTIAVFPA